MIKKYHTAQSKHVQNEIKEDKPESDFLYQTCPKHFSKGASGILFFFLFAEANVRKQNQIK